MCSVQSGALCSVWLPSWEPEVKLVATTLFLSLRSHSDSLINYPPRGAASSRTLFTFGLALRENRKPAKNRHS